MRVLLPAALAVAASPQSVEALSVEALSAEALSRPPALAACTACHTLEAGKNGFGPSLFAVGGRKAASLPGYAYSDALKASGLTWDAATLDRWLSGPQKLVPGTRMPYAGVPDPKRRDDVVEFLMALK
jgi:cytochrome c